MVSTSPTGVRASEELNSESTNQIFMIEINPRFPAWVHFATEIGVNLPQMVVDIMNGIDNEPILEYPQNKMYVRYTGEFVTNFKDYMKLLSTKEL
jgi:carbamoyl-phosphate synthase large subunit